MLTSWMISLALCEAIDIPSARPERATAALTPTRLKRSSRLKASLKSSLVRSRLCGRLCAAELCFSVAPRSSTEPACCLL
eukprot:scaffold2461_cov160-Pinguiococcus_pyrenoidosus.AAC.3